MSHAAIPAFLLPLLLLSLSGCRSVSAPATDPLADETSRRIVVDGMTIHYRTALGDNAASGPEGGAQDSTPLLLIHGWMGSSYDFRLLLDHLGPHRTAIALDLPGSGLSDKKGLRYSMGLFVDTMAHFLDALGLERVILVGHSFGGSIAVHFASSYPERAERLVLIDPDGLEGEEGSLALLRDSPFLVELMSALNNRTAIAVTLRTRVFSDPSYASRAFIDSIALTALTPEGRKAQKEITKQVLGRDPVDALLPRLRMPVLLLWGEEDRVLEPRWASEYLRLLPQARLAMLPGCGHMPQIERAEATAGLIAEFTRE